MAILRRFTGRRGDSRRQLQALGAMLAVAAVALLGSMGRIAETRAAASSPMLAALGPGKLGLLRAQQLDSEGKAPKGMDRFARAALPGAPLAFEPFFGVAAVAFRGRNEVGGEREAALLREALRRNPRSREARLLLLRQAVGRGQLKQAIDQIAVLGRLSPGMVDQLMLSLGAAVNSERTVDEATQALRAHPELYHPFVQGYSRADKPAALTIRLVSQLPAEALADPRVRRNAVALLVKVQAFSTARQLWGAAFAQRGELLHSPDFSDRRAPPPFNWEFTENETGVAERAAGGGVDLAYYGRSPGRLLSQLLTLGPGAYRLAIDYRSVDGTSGAIGLEVRCAGQGEALAMLPLGARAGADGEGQLAFTVPADGCAGQVVQFIGRALEERVGQEAMVRRLTLTRGGPA